MVRVLSYVLFLASLSIFGTTVVHALDAADLPDAVENAKTAADHEAIAAYFAAQATAARAEAESHRRMGAIYGKHKGHGSSKGIDSPLGKTMPPHCDQLATDYEAAAKNYDAMAAAHREAAGALR